MHRGNAIAEIEECPLSRRAWALQERLLSPHIVHFGRNQLFWECNELRAGETFPQGLDTWLKMKPSVACDLIKMKQLPSSIKGSTLIWERRIIYLDWEVVVRNHTAADLTHRTDRLLALSAIAKWYAVWIGDEFVAGLWQNDLLRQLCWFRKGPKLAQPLLTNDNVPYRAPSWSGAALNSQEFNSVSSYSSTNEDVKSGTRDGRTELLDVCVTPVGEDITGQVSNGVITIRGPLVCECN